MGNFIHSDPNNFGGVWRNYMRIRVAIDVRVSLKSGMKIKRPGGNWLWINFRYERLPSFCFICGIIGHSDRFCERLFASSDGIVEKQYGVWLRAATRRNEVQIGEKWLRTAAPAKDVIGVTPEIAQGGTEGTNMVVAEISKSLSIQRGKITIMGSEGHVRGGNHGGGSGASHTIPCLLESAEEITVVTHNKKAEGDTHNLGLVLIDPKRRRKDEGTGVLGSEGGLLMGLSDMNVDVQKNLEKAGLGVQARLGL